MKADVNRDFDDCREPFIRGACLRRNVSVCRLLVLKTANHAPRFLCVRRTSCPVLPTVPHRQGLCEKHAQSGSSRNTVVVHWLNKWKLGVAQYEDISRNSSKAALRSCAPGKKRITVWKHLSSARPSFQRWQAFRKRDTREISAGLDGYMVQLPLVEMVARGDGCCMQASQA